METAVGPAPRAGQARDPHRRHRLRDRQDVGRPGAAQRGPRRRPDSGVFVPTGQTGHDDRGLGRRRRPGRSATSSRAPCEWLVEEGERLRRLGHRRGPGLARPPGLQRRHPRADPRRDAARDGPGPQGRAWPTTTSTTCRSARSRSRRCARSSDLHERIAGLVAPSKVVAVAAQHVAHRRRRRGPAGRSRRSPPRPGCRPTTRSASAATPLWDEIEAAVDALPWVGGDR